MAGYGTDGDFATWLTDHGITLPGTAPAPAVLRQIGSEYVDAAYAARLYCSEKTGGFAQERAWPRTGHTVNGTPVPDTLIPQAWVNASYRAAANEGLSSGWASEPSDPARTTKREKAGEVEREFFGADDAPRGDAAPGFRVDPMIDGLVWPFLCPVFSEDGETLGFWAIGSPSP